MVEELGLWGPCDEKTIYTAAWLHSSVARKIRRLGPAKHVEDDVGGDVGGHVNDRCLYGRRSWHVIHLRTAASAGQTAMKWQRFVPDQSTSSGDDSWGSSDLYIYMCIFRTSLKFIFDV